MSRAANKLTAVTSKRMEADARELAEKMLRFLREREAKLGSLLQSCMQLSAAHRASGTSWDGGYQYYGDEPMTALRRRLALWLYDLVWIVCPSAEKT